jgi:ligand-binding sensor domain-containing protein
MKIRTIFIFLILPCCLSLYGFEWQTYTNSNSITSLASQNDQFWAASSGGALRFDPASGNVFKYTNTHGVGGNDLRAAAFCNSLVWFGSSDGKLSSFGSEINEWKQYLFIDRNGAPLDIGHLLCDGKFLWVSSNIGISLFDTERHGGEIKETYRRFGDLPTGTQVNSALIKNDTIWLATANGIAYADKNDPNLLDFTRWRSLNRDSLPALPGDNAREIFLYDGQLWIKYTEAVVELLRDGEFSVGRIVDPSRDVYSAAASNDTLYVGCSRGLLLSWHAGQLDTIEINGLDSSLTTIDINPLIGKIIGSLGQGIFYQDGENWSNVFTQGLARNRVVDMAETGDGRIWLAHDMGFLSSFDGSEWRNLVLPESNLLTIEADGNGNVWVGTFGKGVYRVTPDLQITNYNVANSSLMGVEEDLDFIVVTDIQSDPDGLLWFGCYRGYPTRPISFYDPSSDQWEYYSSGNFGFDPKILALYSDGDRVWTGFENNGVFLVDYGDDPFNTGGLVFAHYTRSGSLLPSDHVNLITADNNGLIWVGSDMGLAYFDPGINRFIRTLLPEGIGPQIRDILFDLRNNIWVATGTGLALRETGEIEFEYFTTENSPITADNVNSILFDSQRRLWIGTDFGVSVLTYEIGAVTDDVKQVFAYPNPFILTESEKVLFNYAGEVEVEIFSLDGRKIKTILSNTGWDGTNENGDKVASGLYLFYIKDQDGNSFTGKIGVVRK